MMYGIDVSPAVLDTLMLWTIGGVLVASIISLVPGLHIYNFAGLIILATSYYDIISSESLVFLFLGMISGYAILNIIPGVFLSVPDESTVFVILPAQKYLMQRRGYEAVVLSGLGGLGGLLTLVLVSPFATRVLPALRAILGPHFGWILWAIIFYMALSEWPKGTGRAAAGWQRWWEGWKNLVAGITTFVFSGILGMILMSRMIIPISRAYQNLTPAFIGLFAVPWVIQNLLAGVSIPPQNRARSVDAPLNALLHGTFAGVLGGLFAAFFPVITGGIGALLAGHATAQRDDRVFIISQGASKVVYYVGSLLLFFVPGLHMTRGGMAWMLSTRISSYSLQVYYLATAAALFAGVLAFFLSLGFARVACRWIHRINYHIISWFTFGILILVVVGFTGIRGLLVCAVATAIGLIPVLWGARRMNAMGILLLPIAFNMMGW
ncbi:MAG: tripartite tricarboxylate transporter permease [Anaerolineae bacterium]|nr:tripartite tricarboxylate transporter permease [Anaerolineae bacterium]